MRVILSAAVTADGYLDDNGPGRLVISTPGDWAAVLRLRAGCDAILVGAETVRRDNPSLSLRDDAKRARRAARGLRPDLSKAVVTRSGRLDPSLRFFTEGDADRYVFSPYDIPELEAVATVISSEGAPVTAVRIVTELEKRGIRRLLVEGGAQTLGLFLGEGLADEVRYAVNPRLALGSGRGGARFRFEPPAAAPCRRECIDGMEIAFCTLHEDTTAEDLAGLREAIAESRRCTPSETSYCVGAVIRTCDGRGAAIWSSMEPCSQRASEPESCTQLILRHGFARVAFALYEPDRFVCCRGALMLREAGLDVRCYPELGEEVRAVNAHLWR